MGWASPVYWGSSAVVALWLDWFPWSLQQETSHPPQHTPAVMWSSSHMRLLHFTCSSSGHSDHGISQVMPPREQLFPLLHLLHLQLQCLLLQLLSKPFWRLTDVRVSFCPMQPSEAMPLTLHVMFRCAQCKHKNCVYILTVWNQIAKHNYRIDVHVQYWHCKLSLTL